MVTVKTLRAFCDVKCHVTRSAGDTFEASEERVAEISQRLPGYIEVIDSAGRDLSRLTKAELLAMCEERGVPLPKRQNKADLIAALEG